MCVIESDLNSGELERARVRGGGPKTGHGNGSSFPSDVVSEGHGMGPVLNLVVWACFASFFSLFTHFLNRST